MEHKPTVIEALVAAYHDVKKLGRVVGTSRMYMGEQDGESVYRAPLLVESEGGIVDTVGLAEIVINVSGEIRRVPTQEEIDRAMSRINENRRITADEIRELAVPYPEHKIREVNDRESGKLCE